MKYFLIICSCFVSFLGISQDTWQQVDSVNGPGKSVTTSFVIDNEAYLVGGLTNNDFTRKMYSYNPNSNDWDDELSWGGELGSGQNRGSAVSFAIAGKAYVGLGQGNSALYYKDFWTYDPVTETWTQLADFAGSARHGAVGFANETHGFVGTGQSVDGLEKDFYRFDPANNSWTQLNDFGGSARKFATVCMMGDEAYLSTGDDGVLKNDLWQYKPATDTWTQKTSMPGLARVGAVSWGTFPTLYVATGDDGMGNYLNDVWEYNWYGNAWTPRTSLPGPGRTHATAFVINNIGYIATGYNDGFYMDDCWAYSRILGVDEALSTVLSVYPNPTSDLIQWKDGDSWSTVSVMSANGELLQTGLASEGKLDVSRLPQGIYFVRFSADDKEQIVSFVKQ